MVMREKPVDIAEKTNRKAGLAALKGFPLRKRRKAVLLAVGLIGLE